MNRNSTTIMIIQQNDDDNNDHDDQDEADENEALCPECGVRNGQPHRPQCDVARCETCGGQRLSCGCDEQSLGDIPWDGDWPGAAECRRRGWWAKLVLGEEWQPCGEGDPGAHEDLNRLAFLQAEGVDGLYDPQPYDPHMTPPLTYGPTCHPPSSQERQMP